MINTLINDDCINVLKDIKDKSVDLVLVDLPYGQTACEWDIKIDLKLMWEELKRICKDNSQYIFFTTTKFGNELINSNPKWFRYDLVWEKSKSVGFLSADKMPLRNHEMIYIFNNPCNDDIEICYNLELREYAKNIMKFINKTSKQVERELGNRKAEHFLQRVSTSQFGLPTEETYNKLIELYKINEMEGFISYNDMRRMINKTYNPQKTEGKPYKVKGHKLKNIDVYGKNEVLTNENLSGDRHPTSIIKFNQPSKSLHPTQKPTDLCEWLIKTYSNEEDLVLDFCMGSGSTIEACINTKRNYIGIEKDKTIYDVATNRINNLI